MISFRTAAVLFVSLGSLVLTGVAVWTGAAWAAILPAVVSLALAVVSHRILLALACGGLCGAVLIADGNVPAGAFDWVVRDVLGSMTGGEWKVVVVAVTLLMGGFAALLERSGALGTIFHRGRGARAVEGGAFFAGIACFFDGLANSLLVGRVMRGAFDRCGLARERLAYIADSTASPVACVGIASTWIAYQLAMISEGAEAAGVQVSPYGLYLAAWPSMFYCWAALACVGLFVFTGWTIGPMRRARAAAPENGAGDENADPDSGLWRAAVPLLVLLGGLIGGLWFDGARKLADQGRAGFSFAEAVGAADSGRVLLLGTLAACAAAAACFPRNRSARAGEVFLSGAQGMLYPVAILVLAWALGATLKQLDTAGYVVGLVSGKVPLALYPALVFVVGCLVAFGTGTSWGTMGVMMPVALPAAIALAGPENLFSSPLVAGTVAAVMSGSVFGDHCSPVSDTTIVSATASGCDTWAHTLTQLPYALIAGVVTLLAGFVPLGMGVSPWGCLAAVVGVLAGVRFFVVRGERDQRVMR
jgi:tetracycline resistance efflux pump